jgi:molybdopterin molybdotransferase
VSGFLTVGFFGGSNRQAQPQESTAKTHGEKTAHRGYQPTNTMAVLNFQAARELVIDKVRAARRIVASETVPIHSAQGRVLAAPIVADRDAPPFHRSTRDGFAVRSADVSNVPAHLKIVGQARAGVAFAGVINAGECAEIMTGAPLPDGADAVVMVEYTRKDDHQITIDRSVAVHENVVLRGSEAHAGDTLLPPGHRLHYAELAMAAAVGCSELQVFARPRVAILPTGDEIVEVNASPGPYEIRNSNSISLQAQVRAAGGEPQPLGIAPDNEARLHSMIEVGLRSDLLLLSGGVSAGKYDLVEPVLANLGAEFYFEGVLIQPGKPLVFGKVGGKVDSKVSDTFFFGLPGNPLSTMVTFELFVRPALALLGGERECPLTFTRARLARDIRRKPGLAAFLPAILEGAYYDPQVSPVEWKGSGDVASLTRANCFLAIPEEASELAAGDWVSVLLRP